MPICRRSTTRRARLLAAIALAPLLVGASEPQDAAGQHRDGNARTRIQDQGEAAMERVKRAAEKSDTILTDLLFLHLGPNNSTVTTILTFAI